MDFTRSLVTEMKGISIFYLLKNSKINYFDPKVLIALEISALKVRLFGKKWFYSHRNAKLYTIKGPRFTVSPC
jgi:hypothetical protein